jgi:hypothetical protein
MISLIFFAAANALPYRLTDYVDSPRNFAGAIVFDFPDDSVLAAISSTSGEQYCLIGVQTDDLSQFNFIFPNYRSTQRFITKAIMSSHDVYIDP